MTAAVIYQLLLDLSLGATTGSWKTHIGFLPEVPDSAICVYDTAGKMDGRLMADGKQIVHPGIQIRVRGISYAAARAKVDAIALALSAVYFVSVAIDSNTAYTVQNVSQQGDIMSLGMEEEGDRRRHYFTYNATVTLTQDE